MIKNNLLTLLVLLSVLLTSCDKKVFVDPSLTSPVEGQSEEAKWNLKSIYYKINSLGQELEETAPYQSGYLNLLKDNKLKTNLASGSIADEFLVESAEYESKYRISGNKITLDIKDLESNKFIPYVFIIEGDSKSILTLKATKTELLELAKAIDKINPDEQNEEFIKVWVQSIDIKLSFTK